MTEKPLEIMHRVEIRVDGLSILKTDIPEDVLKSILMVSIVSVSNELERLSKGKPRGS